MRPSSTELARGLQADIAKPRDARVLGLAEHSHTASLVEDRRVQGQAPALGRADTEARQKGAEGIAV